MVVLPSSPVWYYSRGIDCSHNGVLAFGSRNLIYILDLNDKAKGIIGSLAGHTDKVTSCSFCPNVTQDQLLRLVSGSEDCTTIIWDVRNKLILQKHTVHGLHKIVSVHWSPANSSLILSGDQKGIVVSWKLDNRGVTTKFNPDGTSQLHLCCLTCSPHDDNIVAVGYKSGAVSLMDMKKNGNIIRKLRGHTSEVHGIVWMPEKNEKLFDRGSMLKNDSVDSNMTMRYSGVIVTGSKDKTVKLWSISRGKCMKNLRVPVRVSKGHKVNEDVARLYTSVFWPSGSKTKFLSSGYHGDLILWNLEPNAENLFEILGSQSLHTGHQRIVFNICRGVDEKFSVISTSMDRQILHWTIPNLQASGCDKPDWSLPTLGGFVYCLSVSPQDPSVLAIGAGDGMIRIWKTRSPKSTYDVTTFWQGVKEKVMSLSWHPHVSGCLAYGTEDGKVGVYDTLSMKPPVVAGSYHLKPVYCLSWGPPCASKPVGEDSIGLKSNYLNIYSCGGDGTIYQHYSKDMKADAIDVDEIIGINNQNEYSISRKHSEVSWSPDYLILGIGNDNGMIHLFTPPYLNLIAIIRCHSKVVNCIAWKPLIKAMDDDRYQIATGSNGSAIYIHDLYRIFQDHNYRVGDNIDNAIVITTPSKSLVGHLGRITGLSYNSRKPSELVSSSYDCSAQVWNTETEKPLFNFRGHHGRLMCVVWTPMIEGNSQQKTSGIIYTGADDYTLHGWYPENQEHSEPLKVLQDFGFGPKSTHSSKKKSKHSGYRRKIIDTKVQSEHNIVEENFIDSRKPELASRMEDVISDLFGYRTLSLISDERENTDNEVMEQTRKRTRNMFPQSVALDNRDKLLQHQDCLKIMQWKMEKEISDARKPEECYKKKLGMNLGLYTDRLAAFRMMKDESEKFLEDGFTESCYNIKLWMGDIVGAINKAAKLGQLTDQLVAMSPMVGHMFWQETASKFANQLLSMGHHFHAVQYMLICGKVFEAVGALVKGKHYREAIALARARLPKDHPLLKDTMFLWAQKLERGGSAEMAAKCFVSLGEFEEAARVLSHGTDLGTTCYSNTSATSLWAATSLAKCSFKDDLATDYGNRALRMVCIETWNWEESLSALSSLPNLESYRFICLVHELLISRLLEKQLVQMLTSMKRSIKFSVEPPGLYFDQIVCHVWEKHCKVEASLETTAGITKALVHELLKKSSNLDLSGVTETNFLLHFCIGLSGIICLHNMHISIQEASRDMLCGSYECWCKRIMKIVAVLQKVPGVGSEVRYELMTAICEIICSNSRKTSCISTFLRHDARPQKMTSDNARKFLLGKAVGEYQYLADYLNGVLVMPSFAE